jgi:hypothetical protein
MGVASCVERTPQPGIPLAHSALHKNEIQHERNRERVSQSPDFTAATAESSADRVADSAMPIFTLAILRRTYCRASRRNKSTPSVMKSTFGSQTSISGWACGFPRNVSPMITKRK